MKYSVGYQFVPGGELRFTNIVETHRESIAEVYFASPGMPSGREPLMDSPQIRELFNIDLKKIHDMGVKLNFLANASCYGELATSKKLEQYLVSEINYLIEVTGGIDSVTTTSPAVAFIIRRHFPDILVRASINMRIGTIQGMEYLAELFDGYYVQRDFNRDMAYLKNVRSWAERNGKTLHLLANSGCLRFCSSQTFHDNLVSHGPYVKAEQGIDKFVPYTCWRLMENRENWKMILQATWIRPEDVHHYEGLFDVMKLATRTHERPWTVVNAYSRQCYHGNLLDLLEPGFSPALAPYILDNDKFPSDWFERTSKCGGQCESCSYCRDVLARVLDRVAS